MDLTPSAQSVPDIPARLRMILAGLRSLIGYWGLEGQIAILLYNRTGRIFARFERMLVRFRAGKLRVGTRRDGVVRRGGATAGRGPALPRKFGWIVGPGGYRAMGYRSQLVYLLTTEPELVAMLESYPQARNVLRPLLRALGVDELPWVPTSPRPPKPRNPRKPRPKPEPFRIKLPRGVITWARREKRLERAREELKRLMALA